MGGRFFVCFCSFLVVGGGGGQAEAPVQVVCDVGPYYFNMPQKVGLISTWATISINTVRTYDLCCVYTVGLACNRRNRIEI